jgi:hypothetical protein
MTRKHFESLAAALKSSEASTDSIVAVANVCAAANPRFDRVRFLRAAGLGA